MRIVMAGETYFSAANGQAVFTARLATGLARAGHTVMAIVPSERRHSYSAQIGGVQVEAIRSIAFPRSLPDLYFSPLPAPAVSKLLQRFGPDVVHIQDHYPICRATASIARHRNIPLLGTNHFLPENVIHYLPGPRWSQPYLNRVLWATMLAVFRQVNLATTPTETAAQVLRGQRIAVPVVPVSCGVDLGRFHPDRSVDRAAVRRRFGLDPGRVLFLFVGRVDQEKRIDVLLRALATLERCDVQLAIAGRGRHVEAYRELAAALKLENKVVFTDYVPADDLPGLLASSDIFAMPSEAELQSIATLEAMACGLPVLAANARALPELVQDDVNGHLFVPGNVQDAARRISQFAGERALWEAMGEASIARASTHGIDDTIQRYSELYRTLVTAKQSVPEEGRPTPWRGSWPAHK